MTTEELQRLAELDHSDTEDSISFSGTAPTEQSAPTEMAIEPVPETDAETGDEDAEVLETPVIKFHKKPKNRLLIAVGIFALLGGFAAVIGNKTMSSAGTIGAVEEQSPEQKELQEEPFADVPDMEKQNGTLKSELALSTEEADLAKINAKLAAKKEEEKDGKKSKLPPKGKPTTPERTARVSIPPRSTPTRTYSAPRPIPVVTRPAPRPAPVVAARPAPAPVPTPAPAKEPEPEPIEEVKPNPEPVSQLTEQQLAFLDNSSRANEPGYETSLVSQQQAFLDTASMAIIPRGSQMQGEITGQAIALVGSTFDISISEGVEGIPVGSTVTAEVTSMTEEGAFSAQIAMVNGAPLKNGEIDVRQKNGDLLVATAQKRKKPFGQSGIAKTFLGIGQKIADQAIENALPGDGNGFEDLNTVNLLGQPQQQQFQPQEATTKPTLIHRDSVSLYVKQPATLPR